MPDWTKLYQRKIKEAALKAAPVAQPAPVENPHKKIKDDAVAPTNHNKSELAKLDSAPCAENINTHALINLKKPTEVSDGESSVDKVVTVAVREE
ncbi:hypothetical protein SESBI_49308, partial [Sesbania bispinosa]